MVALRTSEPEESFLEDRIFFVPKRESETEPALPVRDSHQPIFTPSIGSASGVVVGEIVPARALGRVVLAHGGPLALGQVGTPSFPVPCPLGILLQTFLLCAVGFHSWLVPWISARSMSADFVLMELGGRWRTVTGNNRSPARIGFSGESERRGLGRRTG
jgi:hypothetical protein